MRNWHFTLAVTGRGAFPLDMLRYAQAYPLDHEAVENMGATGPEGNGKRTVRVVFSGAQGKAMSVVDRFESFGWKGTIVDEIRA